MSTNYSVLMDIFEAIRKRHCYRGPYQPTPVPREDLQKILEAGLAAPSGCNKQTTACIGLDDSQLVNTVMGLVRKNGFEGENAPAGICVLTLRKPAYGTSYFNIQDYAAAIENMLIAAAALGYASCWIEGQVASDPETQKQMAQMLNIPAEYTVAAFLPVGIAAQEIKHPSYKPFPERAWYNRYGNNN